MNTNRFYLFSLLFILAVLGFLSYKILSPFLEPIAWAIVIAIVFYPVYALLSNYIRIKPIASITTVVLILAIIIGPLFYLSFMLIDELTGVAMHMNEGRPDVVNEIYEKARSSDLFDKARAFLGEKNVPSEEIIQANLRKIGKVIIEKLSIKVTNVITAGINFMIMIFTLFFLFKDGPGFLSKAKDYIPFSEEQKDRLESQIRDMISSTVYGGVAVGIIQGILGGAAFYFFGIQSPVLWGAAMFVMSFIPLLGTFSVWGPHALYLIIQGNLLNGIGLALFGALVISAVDNILKPLIIGSKTKMPTIIIFFSVLGGIKLFGLIGLIMGPLIMAVFLSVLEIFRNIEGGINA